MDRALQPQSRTNFFSFDGDPRLRYVFVTDANGRATHLSMRIRDAEQIRGQRVP